MFACLPACLPTCLAVACMQVELQVANHRSLDGPQGLHLKNDICGVVAYEWKSPMTPTICFGRTVCQKLGSECSRVRGIVLASVCAECHQIQGAAPKGRKVTCYTLSVSACSCRLSCYVFHSFQTRSQRVFCCGENGRGQCGRSMQQQQRLCCIKVSLGWLLPSASLAPTSSTPSCHHPLQYHQQHAPRAYHRPYRDSVLMVIRMRIPMMPVTHMTIRLIMMMMMMMLLMMVMMIMEMMTMMMMMMMMERMLMLVQRTPCLALGPSTRRAV